MGRHGHGGHGGPGHGGPGHGGPGHGGPGHGGPGEGPERGRGPRDFGPGFPGPGFPFGPGPGFPPGGPRPFGRGGRRRRGAIREAILSILAEHATNGYGLIKAIAERTGGEWTPSPGSIYPTLQQLVDEGLIEPTSEDRRSDYTLTSEGRAYVEANAEQLDAAWRSAERHVSDNAGMQESVMQLMGVLAQFRFAATDEQRQRAVALIDETRKGLYRILGE